MIYKLSDVCADVRVALDHNNSSAALAGIGDIDTLTLDELIESKIAEAVRQVHTDAPYHLLEQGHNLKDTVYWSGDGSGWVPLPENFLRLVVFRMSDWERPVHELLTPADAGYAQTHSRFVALRGTPQRPVCALGVRPEGRVIEFHSCRSEDAYLAQGVYVPMPRVDKVEGIDISRRCYRAAVLTAAALVCVTLGDQGKAQAMFDLANNQLR